MEHKLWYQQPANLYTDWTEALPVGNGRLGAMVFGGIQQERIQLNEESLWSGGFRDRANPYAKQELHNIRRLLKEDKIEEAQDLARYSLSGTPEYQRTYQTLGDLYINFQGLSDVVSDYERSLCLDEAVATTTYTIGGYQYKREVLASYPQDVIAIHMSSDNPEGFSFDARLIRDRFCETSGSNGNKVFVAGTNGGENGISFHSMMVADAVNGTCYVMGEYIIGRQVQEVTLYVTAATSFRTKDTYATCEQLLDSALTTGYTLIRGEHIQDYKELESRVVLDLTQHVSSQDKQNQTTDLRLRNVQNGHDDIGLYALYFRYGRYLLISCSREGCLPANLQGIWCGEFQPAWDSKYTININAQMNYWPAEITNLSECHVPLVEHLRRMKQHGQDTAQLMYGARGMVAHHNTDVWGDTNPQDTWIGSTYWVMGAAWLCLHVWQHYQYTKDLVFLQDNMDLLTEACLFFVDFLIENDRAELVVSPTVSPENTFYLDNGKIATLCEGCTMDAQILRELFQAYLEASDLLKTYDDIHPQIKLMLQKLPETKIGTNGGIMEWLEERVESEPGHRHISHLFGLFPGQEITPEHTPHLAAAARRTLELRLQEGGGHTGWSRAWIINLWAHLADAELAYTHLRELLVHSTLPNLFDNHPPFQIDGNFGATAAIAHMLLQSTEHKISLLKAVPKQWAQGSVKGLRAHGGLRVDITWSNGELESAMITADHDYSGQMCYKDVVVELSIKAGDSFIYTT